MKKTFTLLFATLMMATAFAQYGQKGQGRNTKANDVYALNDKYDFAKPDKGHNDWYVFTAKEKDMQIAQINREYDRKIREVKSNFFIPFLLKMRQVKKLEDQKDAEIRAVNAKFYDRKNQYGDYGKKDNKRW